MRIFLSLCLLLITGVSVAEENSLDQVKPITVQLPDNSDSELAAIDALRDQLQTQKLAVHFDELPLVDAVRFIESKTEIPIRIDFKALQDVNFSPDMPITLDAEELSGTTILSLIAHEHALAYYFQSDAVVISTPQHSEERYLTRCYDLSRFPSELYYNDLYDVITTTLEPENWDVLGGTGTVQVFQNSMLVSASPRVHAKLQTLLDQLTKAIDLPSENYPVEPLHIWPTAKLMAIAEAKLDSTTITANFNNATREEVFGFLQNTNQLPIILDHNELSYRDPELPKTINLKLEKIPARKALDAICQQFGIGWEIFNETILITSELNVTSNLEIRIYPVRDLLWRGLDIRDARLRHELEQFYKQSAMASVALTAPLLPDTDNLIASLVFPNQAESWEMQGGPCTVIEYLPGDCLVVMQSTKVHRQIEAQLNQIRKLQKPLDLDQWKQQIQAYRQEVVAVSFVALPPVDGNPPLTKGDLLEIASLIKATQDKASWGLPGHAIFATSNGLIVRNQRSVVSRVEEYLKSLAIYSAADVNVAPKTSPGVGAADEAVSAFE
ncbi:hypothetical protein [Bremerella cremea]|uniref:hypothetical protein n=1 Tax=Bremerella cremea TaxID=1031537 RepID=UPI0031EA52AD